MPLCIKDNVQKYYDKLNKLDNNDIIQLFDENKL